MLRRLIPRRLALLAVVLVACAKNQPAAGPAPAEPPAPADEPTDRPGLTAAQCEADGGTVVGDIGDGAIHRPDYVCAQSGEPPIGSIVPEPGSAIAVEGGVCCR